jgi:L-threonylcarbamoyladenylate synthase
VIKKIYKKVNGPFFTTSLNISGLEPIIDQQAALDFQKKYAPAALIVTNTDAAVTPQLSGSASTIVFLNENFQFEIKREGKRSEEVKAHLKKLFNI